MQTALSNDGFCLFLELIIIVKRFLLLDTHIRFLCASLRELEEICMQFVLLTIFFVIARVSLNLTM